MQLFSANGFKGTSITQIETAAGLTPGAGGIYHHFRTKQQLLAAGVERHMARLQALSDIRALIFGLGDLKAELTVMARYVLLEMEREQDLIRVLATESRTQGELLDDPVERLVGSSYRSFAEWLVESAQLDETAAQRIATVGFGALISRCLLSSLGLSASTTLTDDEFVATWVTMMTATIEDIVA